MEQPFGYQARSMAILTPRIRLHRQIPERTAGFHTEKNKEIQSETFLVESFVPSYL